MKKNLLMPVAAMLIAVILAACFKTEDIQPCTPNTLAQDRHIIDSFNTANNTNLTWDSEVNWYYQITNPGNGSTPTQDSLVTFKIVGKTMANIQFMSVEVTDPRNSQGWYTDPLLKFSLVKLAEGGTIRVVVPSSLNGLNCRPGQTSTGQTIPGNSQLIYDVTLTDVRKP